MRFRRNVDDQGQPRKRRRKPLLLALVAGAAGWVYVKVIRAGRPEVDEHADEADDKPAEAARKVADKADEARRAQREHARTGSSNNAAE